MTILAFIPEENRMVKNMVAIDLPRVLEHRLKGIQGGVKAHRWIAWHRDRFAIFGVCQSLSCRFSLKLREFRVEFGQEREIVMVGENSA
jgi:hypothetical protein